MCKVGGGRPGLPVPNSLYGLRRRKATLDSNGSNRAAQDVCEGGGGRPGLPSLIIRTVPVDAKQH